MTSTGETAWLVVLTEAKGLRWVLKNERMAFSHRLCNRARRIRVGDKLILYLTKAAFGAPSRDRPQLQGVVRVTSGVQQLPETLDILGLELTCACDIEPETVFKERQGAPFDPLVAKMSFIKRPEIWGQYVRRGLVELSAADAKLIVASIEQHRNAIS